MQKLREIWKKIMAVARAIIACSTLVGILYLPPDILGLGKAYPMLGQLMPTREGWLIGFAVVCAAYIIWIDVRPFLSRYRATSLKPFFAEGVDGKVVDWVDAAWAIIRAARMGKSLPYAVGHDKTKREQLNWCLVIVQYFSNAGDLPLFVRETGEREWEPLTAHSEYSYHVHSGLRTLYRYHEHPWERDGGNEIFDFDNIVVRVEDLKPILKMFRNDTIQDHPAFNQTEPEYSQLPEDTEEEKQR